MRQHPPAGGRRQRILQAGNLALAVAFGAVTLPAWAAADWPAKPIRLVVPFPAGSFTDVVARVLSEGMSQQLGQPVIVDNKPGANGVLGVSDVVRAPADGYTLLVTNSSSVTINPQLYRKITYQTSDLAPITPMVQASFILVANPGWARQHGINTLEALLTYAKANPGALTYGSAGPGNVAHLGYTMLSNKAGVKTTHVPYKAASQAQMAVLSGEIQSTLDTWSALPQIEAGKLTPLAVSSARRMAQLPDVPTFAEAGIREAEVDFWIGLLAPKGTPPETVQKIYEAARHVAQDPKSRAVLGAQGEVVTVEPAAFAQRIQAEVDSWGAVIQREGLTLD